MKSIKNEYMSTKMGNKPSQTLEVIENEVNLILSEDSPLNDVFKFDLVDIMEPKESFEMYLTDKELKGLAEFILKYLENN